MKKFRPTVSVKEGQRCRKDGDKMIPDGRGTYVATYRLNPEKRLEFVPVEGFEAQLEFAEACRDAQATFNEAIKAARARFDARLAEIEAKRA